MTALNYDFSQVDPNFSGGSFLPVSDDKGWLVVLTGDNGFKPAQSGKGHYLELIGKGQDQAVAGQEFTIRLNLQHTEPKAVAAAAAQLAALGIVCGLPGRITDASELFNKPFRLVSVKQPNSDYTQLADNGIRDVNGNKPQKLGSAPQTAQTAPVAPQQAPQQFAPQQAPQGGWQTGPGAVGGAPQGGAPHGGVGFQPTTAPPGTFGGPAQGGFQPQQAPQQFNPQGGPAPFGGAPQGGQPSWVQG